MNKKPLLWVIAGTGEAKRLLQELAQENIDIVASVATAYGAGLLPPQANLKVIVKRMQEKEMEAFVQTAKPFLVVDATHPYATIVTQSVQEACAHTHVPYLRLVRAGGELGDATEVDSAAAAAEFLAGTEGNIFLTTGSKTLDAFAQIPNYAERISLRILPMQESLSRAIELGYKPANIICMQGPFSEALNQSMFAAKAARFVVTKDTGEEGGYPEKMRAAREVGAVLVVIKREGRETGKDFSDMLSAIREAVKNVGGKEHA